MKTSKLRVGFVQYALASDDPKANRHRLLILVRRLLQQNVKLILLPEVCLGSPVSKKWRCPFLASYKDLLFELKEIARQTRVSFFGSQYTAGARNKRTPQRQEFYNQSFFISPDARHIASHRKIHLFPLNNEHKTYTAGRRVILFKTEWGNAAPLICYDLRFPEVLRKLTFAGARFGLVCAQWPQERQDHWQTLLQARAIENQMFIFACNRTGTNTRLGLKFAGGSCVVSPWGRVLYRIGGQRATGVCDVDLGETEKIRKSYPFLKGALKDRFHYEI